MDSLPYAKQRTLSNEERKRLSSQRIKMDVSPFEVAAITEMRKYQHGRFIIQLLDGIPIRYVIEASYVFFENTESLAILQKVVKAE